MESTLSHWKINFKLRYFYSKGAYLVLVWSTLVHVTTWSVIRQYYTLFQGIKHTGAYYHVALAPVIPLFALAPLLGWLADSKLGNYRVFKLGCFIMFLASVLSCSCVLVLENSDSPVLSFVISGVIVPVVYMIGVLGVMACSITALQLGLDQMPEASAANITSYIAWCVCSAFAGLWISECLYFIPYYCASKMWNDWLKQLFSLLPVVCMTLIWCSNFLLASKWLIVEPESPKALKTIYQVLKFAAKHKAPLNRSALTYWEEDIPSRMDLGKSKYGGPFTTEQVENVKTILKILTIHLPVFLISTASSSTQDIGMLDNMYNCVTGLEYTLVYSPWWSAVAMTIIYEFVLYPLIRNKVPTTLKRVGIVSFMIFLVSLGFLVVNICAHFKLVDLSETRWPRIIFFVLFGVNSTFLINGVLEFVCAQSPYNMRGLFAGNIFLLFFFSISFGALIFWLFYSFFDKEYSLVAAESFSTALSLVGFILHCLLARWYKRRVRDEDYPTQRVVEEVYDRYLSHVH